MSLFGNTAIRLLRENWKSPTTLAQELFSMFSSTAEQSSNAPLTLVGGTNAVAPLTITRPATNSTDPLISFPNRVADPAPPNFSHTPDGGLNLSAPSISLTWLDPFNQPQTLKYGGEPKGSGPDPASPQIKVQTNGGGIPAQVVSGTGDTYQVTLFPKGVGTTGFVVQAKQLAIDPAATIKAGTWTTVVQAGTGYYMQIPVWGDDAP